ncbi:MAG TPA: chemotaxis protein CheB [Pirellulaceae bacterium]|nr:chemotaxis protein CheB [Pirellulaceae bacterium]
MNTNHDDQLPESPEKADDVVPELDEPGSGASFPVVGVGASAGGLEAFTQLLKALPADTGMAFVLVQHLAPSHPSALAEILSRATKMPVLEVRDEPTVEPNNVYVIPPDRSIIIVQGVLQLLPREGRGAHHPIDQFFRALATEQRHRAIGVVLSGTATDGTIGLEEIKAEGGITFAQDATAQHEGMPHSAIASGCVDFVLPPDGIAREIVRIAHHPYVVPEAEVGETSNKPDLDQIVQILRHGTGVDFTGYKFNTLYRRITRRMVFRKLDSLAEYVQCLRQTPAEIEALYSDILIGVTSFFRDKESFEALKTQVFPRLIQDRSKHDPVRLWTLGCSTGQEAYSLAMAFTEAAEAAGSSVPIQLFASDLNAAGIEKARAGVYPKDIEQDVSAERLRRFFTEVDGSYRIAKSIRDACVFSRHNVLADPPFSRVDLISCRNLLIYLEPVLQKKIMPTLHYALQPAGCLWLGGSETIGTYRDLFDAQDAKHKIYIKKPGSGPGHGHLSLQRGSRQHGGTSRSPFVPGAARPSDGADLHREADRVLSAKFAPPGVLVSADLEILQYRGDTGAYLAPAPGKASLNLLKMLREGLLVAVRAAVLQAGKEQAPVREEGLQVKSNGGYHEVAIEVIPIKGQGTNDGGFLILFEEPGSTRGVATAPRAPEPPGADIDTTRLTQELAATREYLQSVIEQQEAANEELQSANEEVQSANEELQSTNEELETSKEEIQSSNEELATVNDELNNRNQESNRINDDLVNLLGSVQMPIIMLGPDLRVRRFTPAAEKLLNLVPADKGRPLTDLKLNLDNLTDLESLLAEVLDTVSVKDREVRDKDGRWYSLRLRPYKTLDNRIDGVVAVLVDVDALKRAHAYTESIVATVREPLLVLDANLRVRSASDSFFQTYRVAPEETIGRPLYDLGNGQWNIPQLRRLLEEVLPQASQVENFEVEHEFETIGKKTMLLNARRLVQGSGPSPSILLAIEDITARKRAETDLKASEVCYRRLFESAKDGILILDAHAASITDANPFIAEMLGYSENELKGKELWQIGLFNDAEASKGAMRELQENGYIRYEDLPLETKAGRLMNVEFVSNVYGEDGDAVIQCNVRDITKRRETERALAKALIYADDIIATLREPFVVLDSDLRVKTANRSFYDSFHVSKDETENQFVYDLGNGQWDIPALRTLLDQVLSRNESVHDFEVEHSFPALGQKTMLLNARPFPPDSEHPELILLAVEDVSAMRERADELAEANRRKDEFLAMLAHELRNPLAPIRNAAQVLRHSEGTGETVRSASAMIERQVGQMVRLVDDLLDVSRINQGKIELRRGRIELASHVHHAVEAARSMYKSMGHDLTVTLPPKPIYLNADPTRLTQVLGNLLNNACKFTDKGGRISLAVEEEDGRAVIRVQDTGIGIAADQLPRIFDMFTQVDTSLERSVSGLGIGLTLVKSLVEMHDGTVEVSSAGLGHGSEFVVRLPVLAVTPESPPEPTTDAPPMTTGRRILVVDDNRDSAISLAMLLKCTGNETHTAYDGVEAVEAAAKFQPEVVFLDIGLPKLNGYEVARKIREQPWGQDMVLVALTGWGKEEDRQKSKEAGFNAHLVKPLEQSVLMKLLAEL